MQPYELPSIESPDSYANPSADHDATNEWMIVMLDVGQGDATLILGPENQGKRYSLLIDAGRLDPDGGALIAEALQDLNVTELNATLLTHYDADHMGGFVSVYGSTSLLWSTSCDTQDFFPTDVIIDLGESTKETDSVLQYSSCRDANLSGSDTKHIVIGKSENTNIGYTLDLGEGVTATVVAGGGYVINQDEKIENVDTDNEQSIALLISGPDQFHFLITGDLTGQVHGSEDAAVEPALGQALKTLDIPITVLHVGHHGSASSSHPEFLQSIQPKVAVISVGDHNTYSHPDCSTITHLGEVSAFILQTETGNTENCENRDQVHITHSSIMMTITNDDFQITTPDLDYSCTVTTGCH